MSSNETLIPIPGRLHSVAVEGNVVGANEVVDDTNYDVPKKQSEINADTALEIENIKAKDSNIESLIPSQATSNNQLADKNFVNSSISTATADFKGTYSTLLELQAVTANANDYGFVVALDAEGNTVYKKYKYTENNGWTFEYDLNNSSFTAAQWATIQSGMTSALTNKLVSLPNNTELQEALVTINNTLNSKQDIITDLSTIRNKATTAYQKPAGGIPSTDLADDVIPSFTIVNDHSGAGDDPDKIYVPSAESHKQLYDGLIEDEKVIAEAITRVHESLDDHLKLTDIHLTNALLTDILNNTEKNKYLDKVIFNGHEYLDLGLPSGNLWATMNLGAARVEEEGYHFMWGNPIQLASENDAVWSNCKYSNDGVKFAAKYNSHVNDNNYYHNSDIKFIVETNDDPARKLWGGLWRTPTIDDLIELFDNLNTPAIETINGIEVLRFQQKNKLEDPFFYIPFCSYWEDGAIHNYTDENNNKGCVIANSDITGIDALTSTVLIKGDTFTKNYAFPISAITGLCIRPVINLNK